jgi:hypothetical protein
MKYASVLLLTFCGLAFGAEDCSEIADHQDRLSCYDFKFPRTETSPSYQKASVLTREVEVDEQVMPEASTEAESATSIISNAEPVEESYFGWIYYAKQFGYVDQSKQNKIVVSN